MHKAVILGVAKDDSFLALGRPLPAGCYCETAQPTTIRNTSPVIARPMAVAIRNILLEQLSPHLPMIGLSGRPVPTQAPLSKENPLFFSLFPFTNEKNLAIISRLYSKCTGGSMDRASDSGSEGWGFESLPVYQINKRDTLWGIPLIYLALRAGRDSNNVNRNMPVAYCCNQFKNWLLP